MKFKSIRYSGILLPLLFFCACDMIINSLSFFPDKDYKVSLHRLPSYAADIIIETSDGIKLQLLYLKHEKQSSKAVIYFHGNAGNLYGRIKEAEKIFDFGPDVIVSGYRGYGRSSGEPTEDGVYIDGETVFNYVIRTLGYESRSVFIYGRSIGTTVAVNTAMDRDIAGVILVTPLTSASDFIKEKYPDIFSGIGYGHFESIKRINRARAPLLVIHGTDDEVIPYSLGVKLYDAYNGEKVFVAIRGGEHNDLEYTDPQSYWGAVKKFLAASAAKRKD